MATNDVEDADSLKHVIISEETMNRGLWGIVEDGSGLCETIEFGGVL